MGDSVRNAALPDGRVRKKIPLHIAESPRRAGPDDTGPDDASAGNPDTGSRRDGGLERDMGDSVRNAALPDGRVRKKIPLHIAESPRRAGPDDTDPDDAPAGNPDTGSRRDTSDNVRGAALPDGRVRKKIVPHATEHPRRTDPDDTGPDDTGPDDAPAGNPDIESQDGGPGMIVGDGGDNRFVSGGGPRIIDGGAGNDTVSYERSNRAVTIDLSNADTNGYVWPTGGDAAGDRLRDIENLTGSNHNDRLTGDRKDNVLDGGHGNDRLEGGAGRDVLTGGGGADVFVVNHGENDWRKTNLVTDFEQGHDRLYYGRHPLWYQGIDTTGDGEADSTVIYSNGQGRSGNGGGGVVAVLKDFTDPLTRHDFQAGAGRPTSLEAVRQTITGNRRRRKPDGRRRQQPAVRSWRRRYAGRRSGERRSVRRGRS